MKAELAPEWVEVELAPTDEVNSSKPSVIRHRDQPMPDVYYDTGRKEFLMQDERGVWIGLTISQFSRKCRLYGITSKTIDGCCHSAFDKFADDIQYLRGVDFAGAIAGFKAGLLVQGGMRFLVTKGPDLLEPKKGDWPTLEAVFRAVLSDEDFDQLFYWHAWVKMGFEALVAGLRKPGQAMILLGPAECGKSLLQDIITVILGGREAKPYKFMTDATRFNSNLAGAEHLRIGDENPHTDIRARRNFGAQLKNLTVEESHQVEAKYRDALTLRPFWRLSISLNDEQENLMVLPPLDEHIMDKMIILKCRRREMPMPTATPEQRKAFWQQLVDELPAYLDWLSGFEIPSHLVSQRFGVQAFLHPAIKSELLTFEPPMVLLDLIDAYLIGPNEKIIVMTAAEIQRELTSETSECRFEARRLLPRPTTCGRYLSSLAGMCSRVVDVRTSERRAYRITRRPDDG
jgi:hypothetical protein